MILFVPKRLSDREGLIRAIDDKEMARIKKFLSEERVNEGNAPVSSVANILLPPDGEKDVSVSRRRFLTKKRLERVLFDARKNCAGVICINNGGLKNFIRDLRDSSIHVRVKVTPIWRIKSIRDSKVYIYWDLRYPIIARLGYNPAHADIEYTPKYQRKPTGLTTQIPYQIFSQRVILKHSALVSASELGISTSS